MGCDHSFREMSLNVISLFIICMKREIHEWQFSSFILILSENLVNFNVISSKIGEIIHNLELRWIVIPWNAISCLRASIFCEREFTDPSPNRIILQIFDSPKMPCFLARLVTLKKKLLLLPKHKIEVSLLTCVENELASPKERSHPYNTNVSFPSLCTKNRDGK